MAIDKINSGSITVAELQESMKTSGYSINEEEVKKIVANNDYLETGTINYTDFLIATLEKTKLVNSQVLWEAFKCFDVDCDGILSIEDLQRAFKKSGTVISENELLGLMRGSDLEVLENINFNEFSKMVSAKYLKTDHKQEI